MRVRLPFRRTPKIEKLERRGDANGLLRALTYEDPVTDRDGRLVDLGAEVRVAAVRALAHMDSRLSHDGLVRALEDPEESVRVAAARALGSRGDPSAAEPLTLAVTTWTDDERAAARAEALQALAALGDRDVPRRAAGHLLTRSDELDAADSVVLRRLTEAGGSESLTATIGDLVENLRHNLAPTRTRTLLVWLAPESVDPLIQALDDPRIQDDAARALGTSHDSRAVEPLCSLLGRSTDPETRQAAAWALGEIMDPAAVEALLLATGDSDYGVRTAAGASFDRLGNVAIVLATTALVRARIEDDSTPRAQVTEQSAVDPERSTNEHAQVVPLITRARPVLRRLLARRSSR